MKRVFRLLGPLLVLLVFAGAIWLLYSELKQYRLSDIGQQLRQILASKAFAAAVALTVLNYIILIAYDWLAVRWVGEKNLALRRIALASFTGYACSYNFGATLAGTTIRFRLYSAWGMTAVKILELLVILGLTFWFGLFGLAGVVFIVNPPQVNPESQAAVLASQDHAQSTQALPEGDQQSQHRVQEVLDQIVRIASNMRLWGIVLLSIAVAYLGLSLFHGTKIRLFGRELPIPPFQLTSLQFLITSADMAVGGLVLYILMHHIPGVTCYTEVLAVYLLVYVAVVLSHVPGGYGVFDAGMLFCLRLSAGPVDVPRDSVIAAIVAFRIIYFWIPLILAIVLLGINEILLRRAPQSPASPSSR